jgi:hypothetical protein
LFRGTKWGLQRLANRHHARNPDQLRRWQLLSREFFDRPGALPMYLVTAPRWNTHAVIATFGPIEVQSEIQIKLQEAVESAESWFFIFYSYPERKTIGAISSLKQTSSNTFRVPQPGQYLIGARYYHCKENGCFPAVEVDGCAASEKSVIPPHVNSFYEDLHRRGNIFFYCLAYHAYPMLRFNLLPERVTERVFLPVGNPETRFKYGTIEPGQKLACHMNSERFKAYNLYVTLYSRMSLPVLSYEVDASSQGSGPPAPVQGFYLVRLQPKYATVTPLTAGEWQNLCLVGDSSVSRSTHA